MGIFSPIVKNAYEGFDSEITENKTFEEAVLNDDSLDNVFDENMDLTECGLQAVIDINENYNMIEKALMGNELVYMEQTGQEYQYTEVVVEGFIDSIKNFLKKVWEKIKALFKRFVMKIDSYTKNDKEFVQKYKKEIYSGKDLTDFTFKGYRFTINTSAINNALGRCVDTSTDIADNTATATGKMSQGLTALQGTKDAKGNVDTEPAATHDQDTLNKKHEKFSDNADKARGAIATALGAKGASSLDEGEFKTALFEALRNGESEKEDLDKIILSDYATELMSSKQAKKDLNDTYKACDKAIRQMEKDFEAVAKEHRRELPGDSQMTAEVRKKHTDIVADANWYLKWCHFGAGCVTQVNAAVLQAINDRSRQYKACIVKAVAHKPSNESAYEESYSPMGTSNFLADLALK